MSYSETTISPKDHVDKNDVSTYWLPRNSINLKTQFEWEATKSFKLDGIHLFMELIQLKEVKQIYKYLRLISKN
ncbi:hypothetical protein NW739_00390 [Mycoplasmopsis felis]|uniref:hypothetical protein n=1 Tax=Mycoplasmopsis felis TaxID=33923 RepID=UPI0021DFF36A|nr:hypothetical protein [Mycoplasmopsis felis]MCU9939305.1 hypothetical protein [Mycoplasmopsis felis]